MPHLLPITQVLTEEMSVTQWFTPFSSSSDSNTHRTIEQHSAIEEGGSHEHETSPQFERYHFKSTHWEYSSGLAVYWLRG